MASLEWRIRALETENKARKASYKTSGGKVKFVMQQSPTWHRVGNNNMPVNLRVKFQPNKVSAGGVSLTTLTSQVAYDSAFTWPTEDATSYNEPQTGDGSVIINILAARVPFIDMDYYFRVVATGPSEGTFTVL